MLHENEGTVDENDQGPRLWSGDDGEITTGFSATQDGGDYEQSPRDTAIARAVGPIVASRQGQAAWMTWYDNNWPAMHTWLSNASSKTRTRAFQLCRDADALYEALKDADGV